MNLHQDVIHHTITSLLRYTPTCGVSPNILPLHLLCVSSTTILLHSTLLQPSYYTLQYYNHLTTLYITTLYNPQHGPHRINRGRSPTATPGLHYSYTRTTPQPYQDYTTPKPGLHYSYTRTTIQLHQDYTNLHTLRVVYSYTTSLPGVVLTWSRHSHFPRYAL